MELISFIPQTAAYLIYYPKTFLLEETQDGIVSITSPETASNLTLSHYQVNQQVTEKILIDIHNDMIGMYKPYTDFRKLETNQDLLLERAYINDDVYWIWWLLSKDNQIMIASVNSENELSDEDYNLYRFMIDKMEIFSS